MATDHEAVDPAGRPVRIHCDVRRTFEQDVEDGARFDAGERCADAVVDASPEREMVSGHRPSEVDVVGVLELVRVVVGRTPQQQECGAGGDAGAAECRVLRNVAHVIPERRLQADGFLNERRDELRVCAQLLLELWLLGEDAYRVAEQAGRGLTAGAEQRVQDGERLEVGEHAVSHAACNCAEQVVAGVVERGLELVRDPVVDLAGTPDELRQLIQCGGRGQPP